MSDSCLKCGAILPKESTCQTIHDELLVFESFNAVPHSIHFMHVTCFIIQHERYSNEALVWAQSLLRLHLDERLTEQQLLHHLRTEGKSPALRTRTWKFNRSADAPPLPKVAWSVTLLDVIQQLQSAEMYSERVKQWARETLQQMVPILP